MSLRLLVKTLFRRKMVTGLLLVQLALTLALLLNSLLLASQTRQQLNAPTGLDLANSITVHVRPTTKQLRQYPALGDLLTRQLHALREIPGVVAAAYANQPPLRQGGNQGNIFKVGAQEQSNIPNVPQYFVSADFMQALGLTLRAGSWPQYQSASAEGVRQVVITESLARQLFNDVDVIGEQLNHGTVAAVVSDFYGHRGGGGIMYNYLTVADLYSVDWGYTLLLRVTPGQAERVRSQLDAVLRQVDSNLEIYYNRTFTEQHRYLFQTEFGLAVLLSLLSGLMLMVSMVSSYSNAHFHVLKSQQEIGIKRALGASRQGVLLELLSEGWLCTLFGAALGIVTAILLNRALSQIIAIPPLEVGLSLLTCSLLMLCVTLATWYPARIATRVSPALATKTQ